MNKLLSLTVLLGTLFFGHTLRAQTYTYTVDSSKATITGFAAGSEPSGSIVVPATIGGYTVTEVGRSAFKDRTAITGISFTAGASITKIGTTAFQGCTGLQSIALPSGITAIPTGLLNGCSALTSVTIPTGVTSIGEMAFADCRSLASISLPAGLASLGESTFMNCRSLTALTIPSGVTSIPGQLCQECRSLTSVSLPAGVTQIAYSSLANCPALVSFVVPSSTTSIGNDAFHGCSGLTSVAINAGLTSIGSMAFEGCSNLSSITVDAANANFSSTGGVLFNKAGTSLLLCPAGMSGSYAIPTTVTMIGEGAFAHCDQLTAVSLSTGISSISADALYYASGLASLSIPQSVSSIGEWAFAGCSALPGATIPASVTSIGNNAFHYCGGMGWALFNGDAPAMGSAVFDAAADDFTVYFHTGKTGFTSPIWQGYPASALTASSSFIAWLTQNGFSPGTDSAVDSNGDGVSLLMAYALGLDPAANLAGNMPKATLDGNSLGMSFYGVANGITYSVQSSTDLSTWGSEDVILSAPDANGIRTASLAVETTPPARFMRLVVSQ